MSNVKQFFRVEVGASEKNADISNIYDKILFLSCALRPTKF